MLLASATSASAQMHLGAEPRLEATVVENGNKQKNNSNTEKPATQTKEATSRTDKKKWAIQIKQGEKWYQLSVSLVF